MSKKKLLILKKKLMFESRSHNECKRTLTNIYALLKEVLS